MDNPTLLVLIKCPYPDCANRDQQSEMIKRDDLKQMLEKNEVRVFGAICGHDWLLSDLEMQNTRNRLAKGEL